MAMIALLAGQVSARAALAEDAAASVMRIYQTTVQTGNAPGQLATGLAPAMNLEVLSRTILGDTYASASNADRSAFRAVLVDVIAQDLAKKLRRDQQFTILSTKPLGGDAVVVRTRVTKPNGDETSLDWKMLPCGVRFCIYDLLSNNASFAAARRDTYGARLQAVGGSLAELTLGLRADLAAAR